MTRKKTQKEFIEEAIIIHGDRYDYTDTIFESYHKSFTFKCKKCCEYITTTPCHHLREKIGCQNCYPIKAVFTKRKTKEEFVREAQKVHNDNYDYTEIESTKANAFVTIKCNVCGNKFKQRVREHLRGVGCNNKSCILNHKKQTCIKRYGTENPMNVKEIKEKIEHTCLKKYGCKNALQNSEIYAKMWATKKERGVVSTSKPEQKIKNFLLKKFPKTLHNHKTELYPFHCDFYIPELNLYIEYQGHQSHGKEPFDPNNKNHQDIVEMWKQKAKEKEKENRKNTQYRKYIHVWTISDPLKRETAKKNNLNWIEFFTIDEFLNWYKSLS